MVLQAVRVVALKGAVALPRALSMASLSPRCSETIFTRAEPTMTPAAPASSARLTCPGVEMPKPSRVGGALALSRSRMMRSAGVPEAWSVPVMPTRERR